MIRPITSDDMPALKSVIDSSGLFPSDMLVDMVAGFFSGEATDDFWLTVDDDGPKAIAGYTPERMTQGTWNMLLPHHRAGCDRLKIMERLNRDPRVFAADTTPGPATPNDDVTALRDADLDKLTDPANGYTLEKAFSMPADLSALFAQLTELKACLDSFRPFDPTQLEKLLEAFDIEYTYNSNRIEGNTLTLMETHLVVNKGITIAGKPLREHLEATNHQEAIDFIRDLATRAEDLTPYNLKQIHALLLHAIDRPAAGVYRNVPVFITGSRDVPPQPYMIDKRMEDMSAF